jgi:hypothetical protein
MAKMDIFTYMRIFDPTQTVIGEPLPIVITADTKLPVHTPAGFGPGSDWSRPTRFDEIHPLNCMPRQ